MLWCRVVSALVMTRQRCMCVNNLPRVVTLSQNNDVIYVMGYGG